MPYLFYLTFGQLAAGHATADFTSAYLHSTLENDAADKLYVS